MKKILGLILILFCYKLSANDTTYIVLPEAQLKLLAVANGGMGNLDCEIHWNPAYTYYYSNQIKYEFNNKLIPKIGERGKEITQRINCGDLLKEGTILPIKIISHLKGDFEIAIKNKESILIQNIIATPQSYLRKHHLLGPVSNLIYVYSNNIYYGVTVTALDDCEVTIIKASNNPSDSKNTQQIKLTRNQSYSIEQLLNNKEEVRFHILNSTIEILSNKPVLTTQYYFENKLPDYFGFNTAELHAQFSKSYRYYNFQPLQHIDVTGSNYCKFISQRRNNNEFYLFSRGANELYINGIKSIFDKDSLVKITTGNYMELIFRNPILILPVNLNSNDALISHYPTNNFDSFVSDYFHKIEQKRITDSLYLVWSTELKRIEDSLIKATYGSEGIDTRPPTAPPDTKLGRGIGSDRLKNRGVGRGAGSNGDGDATGRWGRGSGGVGTSADSGTRKGTGRAKKAGAAGYIFTCNTINLKNAPSGTYNIEVEVDCNMYKTYIGYRGGTAQDDPSEGQYVAKTVQAFLNCATITKTITAICPQRLIVSFTVE